MQHPDTLIIIFAREPVAGQVKTRLIPALGEKGATKLYEQLVNSILNTVLSAAQAPVNLCITPESDKAYFSQWSDAIHFELSVQAGNELGQRMYNALARALTCYSKAILIGTDCPFLSSDDFHQAIKSLDEHDMVFSPAKDGGYVLVGAKNIKPAVFENIDWSTEKVMAQTRSSLIKQQISWQELAEQQDIDDRNDLKSLLLHKDFKHVIQD